MPGPGPSRWTGHEPCPRCDKLVRVATYEDIGGTHVIYEDHECVAEEEGEEE